LQGPYGIPSTKFLYGLSSLTLCSFLTYFRNPTLFLRKFTHMPSVAN
jgi:hypothetical protein